MIKDIKFYQHKHNNTKTNACKIMNNTKSKAAKTKREVFNPVKEDHDGIKAKRAIWSTKSLNLAIDGILAGKKLLANPFYENNTSILKGDLVFERTETEIKEWLKCKNDILYFANTYCKLMTPEGVQHIQLRDYQKKYLRHLEQNRLSVYLSCRQSGKCLSFTQVIDTKLNNEFITTYGDKLKKYFDRFYYNKEKDCYELPLFEIYNLYDKSFKWKIQYLLYKIVYKYEQREKRKEAKKRSTT